MERKLYGVKIILHKYVKNKENTIVKNAYEEMILSVRAENFDDAFEKAEKYAEKYCTEYENPYGETVGTEIFSAFDAFEAFDEEDDVTEIFSRIYSENGKECSEEDLKSFLNKEFNGLL